MSWSAALAGVEVPVIIGPTAAGKTDVALALAEYWRLEVISADSRQIYRGLEIGTAAPPRDVLARVPHHGVSVLEPGARYSAGRFARDASGWVDDIAARGKLPVVVGGTGLYVRALAEGLFYEPPLDPLRRRALNAYLARLDAVDLVRWVARLDSNFAGGGRQRATRAAEVALLSGRSLGHWQEHAEATGAIRPWYVVLTLPRPVQQQRIAERAASMLDRGLEAEVRAVLGRGADPTGPGMDAVGIREMVDVVAGRRTRASAIEAMIIATRQFAKRQATWFRHQIPAPRLMLDATRSPGELAGVIAQAWAHHSLARH